MSQHSFYRITTLAAGIVLSLFLATGATRGVHAEEASEYQVKAAFIFNFAKFVEWPDRAFASPETPLVFCIFGDDPFDGALDALQNKRVKNRPVVVKHVNAAGDIRGCHVLFISPKAEGRIAEVLAAIKDSPVLVVGDTERFIRRGGTIGFLMERNKVVFEINTRAAKGAGLKISSQILTLARNVIE